MKPDKILHSFTAKNGRQVILRTPRWDDLDDLVELINSLVEEGVEIEFETKKTRDEEVDWLSRAIAQLEKDEALYMVAEVDGRVVASSGITKRRFRCEHHVRDLGILVNYPALSVGASGEGCCPTTVGSLIRSGRFTRPLLPILTDSEATLRI